MKLLRMPHLPSLSLSVDDRQRLQHWVRSPTTPQRVALRSQIVLAADAGATPAAVAASVGVSLPTVRLWIRRFAQAGADALLHDAPGRGRRPKPQLLALRDRVIAGHGAAVTRSPTTIRQLARELGVSPSSVWRVLRTGGKREAIPRETDQRNERQAHRETP